MIKDGNYIVLSEDNIQEIMELTGQTETELRKLYEECVVRGHKQVYWKEFNRWYGVQVSGRYEYAGILDNVVQELMIRHGKRVE